MEKWPIPGLKERKYKHGIFYLARKLEIVQKVMGEVPTNKCRGNKRGIKNFFNYIVIIVLDKNYEWIPKSSCENLLGILNLCFSPQYI